MHINTINIETGEIIATRRFKTAQRRATKVYTVRKNHLGLSPFQARALKNISPIILAGIVLAIAVMGISR